MQNEDNTTPMQEGDSEQGDLSRFTLKPGDVRVLDESKMCCAGCRFRTGQASECKIYEVKPINVMKDHAPCPDFKPDEQEN